MFYTWIKLLITNNIIQINDFELSHKIYLDKKQRTALTHAIINGHANVTSYLLRLGANPNSTDSSGNTLVHYAAAYGWYYCMKLLIEAGASLNLPNDWKVNRDLCFKVFYISHLLFQLVIHSMYRSFSINMVNWSLNIVALIESNVQWGKLQ